MDASTEAPEVPMEQPPLTIVLVDDDEMHLVVARRAIAKLKLGVDVLSLGNGAEALRLLGLDHDGPAEPRRIAVVMLDIDLPDLSGWQVLERIRADRATSTVPVVLVTSSDRPQDVSRAYELGANSYLVKRHEPGRPGDYLARAVRYWVELNQASHATAEPLRPQT